LTLAGPTVLEREGSAGLADGLPAFRRVTVGALFTRAPSDVRQSARDVSEPFSGLNEAVAERLLSGPWGEAHATGPILAAGLSTISTRLPPAWWQLSEAVVGVAHVSHRRATRPTLHADRCPYTVNWKHGCARPTTNG
jgi:hypothetical protein